MVRIASVGCLVGVALAAVAAVTQAGCTHRPVVCDSVGSCGADFVCTSTPCASDGGSRARAVSAPRRLLLGPTEIAVVRRGSAVAAGTIPAAVTLGRIGDAPAAVLLRFDVPRDLDVAAAYLLVDRSDDGGSDGAGVGLHTEALVGTWPDGLAQEDRRSASLELRPGGPVRLRIDVTFLRGHLGDLDRDGVALVADRLTSTGVSIAVTASLSSPLVGDPVAPRALEPTSPRAPRLELYLK